jgi:hypothetical protein
MSLVVCRCCRSAVPCFTRKTGKQKRRRDKRYKQKRCELVACVWKRRASNGRERGGTRSSGCRPFLPAQAVAGIARSQYATSSNR